MDLPNHLICNLSARAQVSGQVSHTTTDRPDTARHNRLTAGRTVLNWTYSAGSKKTGCNHAFIQTIVLINGFYCIRMYHRTERTLAALTQMLTEALHEIDE